MCVTLDPADVERRPLLSGNPAGGVQRPTKVCIPKIRLQVCAPYIHFTFVLRRGGWVGWSVGRLGFARILTPPPPAATLPPGSLSNDLVERAIF